MPMAATWEPESNAAAHSPMSSPSQLRRPSRHEADPGAHRRMVLQQLRQDQRLAQAGERLAGQDVRARLCEDLEPRCMEVAQLAVADRISAPVLRAVGQHRAVGTDRPGHEGTQPRSAIGRDRPELIPRPDGQRHRAAHQFRRRPRVDSAALQPREGGLIGRARGHVGARAKVVRVHGADQVGPLDQAFGRPQRVVQVGAAPLELRGQRAVQDDRRLSRQKWVKRREHSAAGIRSGSGCPREKSAGAPRRPW